MDIKFLCHFCLLILIGSNFCETFIWSVNKSTRCVCANIPSLFIFYSDLREGACRVREVGKASSSIMSFLGCRDATGDTTAIL